MTARCSVRGTRQACTSAHECTYVHTGLLTDAHFGAGHQVIVPPILSCPVLLSRPISCNTHTYVCIYACSDNYISIGEVLGFDGALNPDALETDAVLAFRTALWIWMTGSSPAPSCHDVMTRMYRLSPSDKAAGRDMGFGE